MNREINADSILLWDERIAEKARETVRMKHIRNSLLNISRIPPEILGFIFQFNITMEASDPDFARIKKDSFNFLLVCHHWHEVARRTPALWSYWGNSLGDWKRSHLISGITAIDLVLDGMKHNRGESFDGALQDALRHRAARDLIRKVHIRSPDRTLATSIISSLTPEDEAVQHSSIESIVLSGATLSNFITWYHLPKLRTLSLFGCYDLPWDHLKLHTTALVNLSIVRNDITSLPAIPTTSQILSVLSSNPRIRSFKLEWMVSLDDSEGDSMPPVSLYHLKRLTLMNNFQTVFPILRQLELPEKVDNATLMLQGCRLEDVNQSVVPYIREYLRRDARFKERLGVFLSFSSGYLNLQACVIGAEYTGSNNIPLRNPHLKFDISMRHIPFSQEQERIYVDILELLPQESVVYLQTNLFVPSAMDIITNMPAIEYLHLIDMTVREEFPLPNTSRSHPGKKPLPSLRWLHLEAVKAEDDYWGPLLTYLTNRASGGQVVSLRVFGKGVHICPGPLDFLRGSVEELIYKPDPDSECPFYSCLVFD